MYVIRLLVRLADAIDATRCTLAHSRKPKGIATAGLPVGAIAVSCTPGVVRNVNVPRFQRYTMGGASIGCLMMFAAVRAGSLPVPMLSGTYYSEH
jgi:hypothetical protein